MNDSAQHTDILRQVEAGQLSAAEAAVKLAALRRPLLRPSEGSARWLRVRVMDSDTNQLRVMVNLPLQWVRIGLAIGARFVPELEEMDLQAILQTLEQAGQIIQVEDLEKGERIEVGIE